MPESSRALAIFIVSFISLFETISVVVPESSIFFWIPKSIAHGATTNPNGIKVSFANGNDTFINGPSIVLYNAPKKPPDWVIFKICVLDRSASADILLLNTFLNFVFCLVVIGN